MKIAFPKIKMPGFVTRTAAKAKDKAPDLLMGFGVVGVIGGTVMACKASMDIPEIMKDYREKKAAILDGTEDGEMSAEQKKELRSLRVQTGITIGKKYAGPVTVEALSLTGMCTSHKMLKKINTELGVAYMGLYNGFNAYRQNVRDAYGEEADEKMLTGYREETVVVQDENGNSETKTVKVYPNKMPSPYARYFCYGEASGAEKNIDYNERFAEIQENTARRFLRTNRKMMLNDVYDLFGIKHSVAGNRVGWVYDPVNPSGDNDVNLRIQRVYREKDDGSGEWEQVIMIDPNVDGMVEEKMVRMGLMDR